MGLNPDTVKSESEQIILAAGGQICDWLPVIERTTMRSREEIVGRALIMNAMLQIYFNAPVEIIDGWIFDNGLEDHVSPNEDFILSRQTEQLTETEKINLYWYIEGLWALMWLGNLIEALPFDRSVEDYMASLAPDLQSNEDGSKFQNKMRIRPFAEVYKMLDLYFRLSWYTRNGELNGYDTGAIKLPVIMERRRALEWALQPDVEWDKIELNT